MRRAQLRLRQLGIIVAVAMCVAFAAIANVPGRHPAGAGVAAAAGAHLSLGDHREPGGIRWRRTI